MSTKENIHSIFTIRVAAKLTGISPGTIREYERQGLLRTHRDSQSNHRLFTQAEIMWIMQIWHLIHREGLNYEGLRRLLLVNPCWKILNCPDEYHENCKVYGENKLSCWSLEELPECCVENHRKCQTCKVYATAQENPHLLSSGKAG